MRQLPATAGSTAFKGLTCATRRWASWGFGRIGKSVARRASGFDMRVLAYDVMWDEEAAADLGVTYAEPEEIFAEADFISLHLPSTPETYKFVNAALLERMKPSAFIVNTARGSLVDEEALVAAIDAGQLAGAASDVFLRGTPARKTILS